jgi:2-polyprenyl-3-methyl-5-hydroxy-6-metoxy-1,4-benzoquinol methylase
MLRHVFKKAGAVIPHGKIRDNIKRMYHGILHIFNEDDVLYTSDPQVFINKVKKMQKRNSYSKYWAEMEKYSSSEQWPKHHNIMLGWFDQKVIPLLNKDMNIADMPCASGELSFYFSRHVKSIDGFDLSEKMINLAKHTARQQGIGNAHFQQADAQTVVFNKKYDVFMLLWLLMYIYDEENANIILRKIYDSLPPGGYLVVKDSLWENTDKNVYCLDIPRYYYAVYRTIPNFLLLLEKNNFILMDKIILERKTSGWCAMCAIFKKI